MKNTPYQQYSPKAKINRICDCWKSTNAFAQLIRMQMQTHSANAPIRIPQPIRTHTSKQHSQIHTTHTPTRTHTNLYDDTLAIVLHIEFTLFVPVITLYNFCVAPYNYSVTTQPTNNPA